MAARASRLENQDAIDAAIVSMLADPTEVFAHGVDKDAVLLMVARASRLENQDAIDAAIVSMLADPTEARAGIREVHFLPFNLTAKRTALTYVDGAGNMHRVSKVRQSSCERLIAKLSNPQHNHNQGARIPISFTLPYNEVFRHLFLEKLGTSLVLVWSESPGGPWEFVGILPLFDPPRHDSAETIQRALDRGVSVKMITGDQLAIAKETGRRLGMCTSMYPSSSLLGDQKDAFVADLPQSKPIGQKMEIGEWRM
ncbi:unnamed protein product [Ilex paraguariensis]|uniref:Uncharacterized protein n=1 Tax=Ilex paraguariensis TaxID=185542 RepID=A0ABC8UAY6_9AQUA